jgi:hypothetical protein
MGKNEEEEDEDEGDGFYSSTMTRKELRKFIASDKMKILDQVTESFKKIITKVDDRIVAEFSKAIAALGEGGPTKEQALQRDYMKLLDEAIRNLKKSKLNKWESNQTSFILAKLKRRTV